MKAIMMSIRPQYVAKILNGEKTIEIRKRFPKDYVGWVYIYCTKGNDKHEICIYDNPIEHIIVCSRYHFLDHSEGARVSLFNPRYIKGKVVARFWCDKVEEIETPKYTLCYTTKSLTEMNLLKHSCLSFMELHDYLDYKNGTAIHITNLEIFNQPKDISEFSHYDNSQWRTCPITGEEYRGVLEPLTRAPQSFCFIEI